MLRGAPAKAATPITGEPLAANASPGPLPRPKSMLFAAKACCTFASPARSTMSRSMPYLAKRPASRPTSATRKVQAPRCALPSRTVSAAAARDMPAAASAAANAAPAIHVARRAMLGVAELFLHVRPLEPQSLGREIDLVAVDIDHVV